MPALPGRPDLDQLRRQARELLRAAAASDEQALARIRVVSQQQTLAAAQLAIAREYGFASWPKLRAEVLRRQGGIEPDAGARGRRPSPDRVRQRVGAEVLAGDAPVVRPPAPGAHRPGRSRLERADRRRPPQNRAGEQALRRWLSAEGVTGYAQALLVWETFGYPGFLVADADELIDRQYADRPQLRPVFDAVLELCPHFPGRSPSRRAARWSRWSRPAARSPC